MNSELAAPVRSRQASRAPSQRTLVRGSFAPPADEILPFLDPSRNQARVGWALLMLTVVALALVVLPRHASSDARQRAQLDWSTYAASHAAPVHR